MKLPSILYTRKFFRLGLHNIPKMIAGDGGFATFVQKVNPKSGEVGWSLEDNYDYQQEIARSSYADMLHDYDRNKKYYVALKKAIEIKHALGQKAHVLDIGTGTGLLSMMAAKCGADSIVACEGFPPIAEIAKKVIADNNLSDHIKVVSKRSTELKVGPGLDLQRRANILVTEVFDTELIGEGAIETFNHANEHLLEADSIVVPWSSDVYAVALDSKMLSSFNRINSQFPVDVEQSDGLTTSVHLPRNMVDCSGNAGVHDLQVSQIPTEEMKLLSKPLKIFKFDFFKQIPANETSLVRFKALHAGQCNVVVMYWTLDMDQDGATVVSCSPQWVEPSPWRDHWMQAAYHLKNPTYVEQDEELELIAKHDQYSMWFDVRKADDAYNVESLQMPVCTCGLHGIASRTRLYAMNDSVRWAKYAKLLRGIRKNANVLYIGDTSLLPVAAAKLGAKKVFCAENSSLSYSVMSEIMKSNGLTDQNFVILKQLDKNKIDCRIDVVIAEPYFRDVLYPWDNLRFRYLAADVAPDAQILPGKMRLWGVPMEFEHLHKIRAPLFQVEGFKMASFDKLIANASHRSDSDIDVQPMFEYPGKILSPPKVLLEVSLDSAPNEVLKASGSFQIESEGQFHGVVLWAEWDFGTETISTGLENTSAKWDLGTRQAVRFVEEPYKVAPSDTFDYDLTISLDSDDTGILRLSRPL